MARKASAGLGGLEVDTHQFYVDARAQSGEVALTLNPRSVDWVSNQHEIGPLMRYLAALFIILFASNWSVADEPNLAPNDQLDEIISLFADDLEDDARTKLLAAEEALVASVQAANTAEAHLRLGRAYFFAEMDTKAAEALRAAIRLDPTLADAHFFAGLIRKYHGDYLGAESYFRAAVSAKEEPLYYVELGRVLQKMSDPASASMAFQSALLLEETNFDANFDLANILAVQGDTAGAEKHYLAAIEQKPTHLLSLSNLGQVYQNTQRHLLAIEQFEKVVRLYPDDWRAYQKLVQENEAIKNYAARDSAIERIYEIWQKGEVPELTEQGFYIREQLEIDSGKLFVLEYFELKGPRARKFVFKLQDTQTGELMFDVLLGSYDLTTEIGRASGELGPDERYFHIDGYAPNGSHYTYAFFNSMPPYETVKAIALDAFSDVRKPISSTVIGD